MRRPKKRRRKKWAHKTNLDCWFVCANICKRKKRDSKEKSPAPIYMLKSNYGFFYLTNSTILQFTHWTRFIEIFALFFGSPFFTAFIKYVWNTKTFKLFSFSIFLVMRIHDAEMTITKLPFTCSYACIVISNFISFWFSIISRMTLLNSNAQIFAHSLFAIARQLQQLFWRIGFE